MSQQKGSTVEVLIGFETTYGTAASVGFKVPVNAVNLNPDKAKNKPRTLTGSRNPTQPFAGNKNVSGSIVIPLDSVVIWYWMKAMFGAPTTTGTGPYVHEYKIGDTIPSLTIEEANEDLTTDAYLRYVGCKISSFSIDTGGDGEYEMTLNIMGADYSKETSAFDGSPTDLTASLARLDNLEAAILEGGGSLDNATGLSITIDNDLDGDTFVIGGSGKRGALNEGIVGVGGNVTMLLDDDAITVLDKAIADTESSLKLTVTNSATSVFELEIQELEYGLAAPGLDGPRGRRITLPFQGFYVNGSETSAIVARVTNSVPHT